MPKIFKIFLILIIFGLTVSRSAYSTTFNKYNSNPIIDKSQNNWDSSGVAMPSVIKDGLDYKLYFTGFSPINDINRFSIGYASSSSLTTWIKNPDSIYSKLQINKDVHDQNIIVDDGVYFMWYVTSENGGSTNFSIYRAMSFDGITWFDNPTGINFKPQIGFGSGNVSAPYVLKTSSGYEMWFSSSDIGVWAIGHATSPDGLSWTPDPDNPVLVGQSGLNNCEGTNVNGPTVIKDNAGYHMWFVSGPVGTSTKICYAFSATGLGKTWVRDQSKNPVLEPGSSGAWDSGFLGDASAVKVGDTTLLFYAAYGPNSTGIQAMRIGLAYDGPLPTPFATPSPTPSITPSATISPSPSPSLSLTPTPTPDPDQVNKIIVIPGLGGSWNRQALLTCSLDTSQDSWIMMPAAKNVYEPIGEALKETGISPIYFYYDWRKDPRETVTDLEEFIIRNTEPGEKVYLLGHSLGGLVARAYLEKNQNKSRALKILTVGSPHQGSVMAYPAWSGDEIIGDFRWHIAATLVKAGCTATKGKISGIYRTFIPSLSTILPTFPYLIDQKTNQFKPISSMQARNPWLPNSNYQLPYYGVTTGTLSGDTQKTLEAIFVGSSKKIDILRNRYLDGSPIDYKYSSEGDGTILTKSSSLDDSWNKSIDYDHSKLMTSYRGMYEILEFFGLSLINLSQTDKSQNDPENALVIASEEADFDITTPDNQILSSQKDGLIIMPNTSGVFSLNIKRTLNKQRIHIIQILPGNKLLINSYMLGGLTKNKYKINFNPSNPQDNPLDQK